MKQTGEPVTNLLSFGCECDSIPPPIPPPPNMPAELVQRDLYLVAPSISVFDSAYRGVDSLTAKVVVSLDMTPYIEEKGLGGGRALRHPTVTGRED